MNHQAAQLTKLHQDTRVPPPELVQQIDKGKYTASAVGHADITDILLAHDPLWTWEPLARDDTGLPKITVDKTGRLAMWATLTIHGHTRIEVGTTLATSPDPLKELVGDFLRRGAMRFGVSLKLWSKSDWAPEADPADDATNKPDDAVTRAIARGGELEDRLAKLTPDQTREIKEWRRAEGLTRPVPKLDVVDRTRILRRLDELDQAGWGHTEPEPPPCTQDTFGDEPF